MKVKLLIFLCLIIFSCTKGRKQHSNSDQDYGLITENLPDTIILNKTYDATFYYESEFDTITLKDKDSRFIFLYITTQNGEFNEVEEIKKVKHEAFIMNDKGYFDFTFQFENIDSKTVKGLIKDLVILDNYYIDGKTRMLTNLTTFEFDCKVIKDEGYE